MPFYANVRRVEEYLALVVSAFPSIKINEVELISTALILTRLYDLKILIISNEFNFKGIKLNSSVERIC